MAAYPDLEQDPWYDDLKAYIDDGDSGGGGGGGGATGVIYGGDSAYNLSPSRTGIQNRVGLLALIADAHAAGKKAMIPAFISAGAPQLIPLAPTPILIDPDLGDLEIVGEGKNAGFKQVVDSGTSSAVIARTPMSGFAADNASATPGNQNYWVFVDRSGDGNNAITWRDVTFEGGHGTNNSGSAPNSGVTTWTQWGIGLRVQRRGRLYSTVHGGSMIGIQFDGDFDHTYCENVDSGGNWINCRFGPRQNEKDNIFVNCSFANASLAGISVAPTGFLGGSSFFGGHLGTSPYGIYFEAGTKSSGLKIQMQNMNFDELIFEGCGNFKIFCEDGDSYLQNIRFHDAQWHGLEVGDHSHVHVLYCSTISNLARANTGVVTITAAAVSGVAQPIVGDYVIINGFGEQPIEGVKVGGGSADTTLNSVYQVLTVSGTTFTLQGKNTTVVASGAVATTGGTGSGRAYMARVGCVKAGKLGGWGGNLQITGDEVDARDRAFFGNASTTIQSPSGGAAGNSGTVTVVSTTGFPDNGIINLPLSGGTFVPVAYTGTTGTTFTGCTGGSGTIAANGATVALISSYGGYGTAAEMCFDVVTMINSRVYDAFYLPTFGGRTAAHAANSPSFWQTSGGEYFLARRTNTNIAAKSVVQFNSSSLVGDVEVANGSNEPCGIVGGTDAYCQPVNPAGVWSPFISGSAGGLYMWVQDKGFAEVRGSGTTPQGTSAAAAGGRAMVADTGGQAYTLAAGTAPTAGASAQFRCGKAVGTASVGTSIVKLG